VRPFLRDPKKMFERRSFLRSLGSLLGCALFSNAAKRESKVVFTHDLPGLSLKNWSITAVEVSYAPGESSSAHRHPGITIVYVLEGEVRSKVGDGPEKTYAAGQMFLEQPSELHAVSGNASTTKPARFLALLLAEKGKPLTTPA